MPSKAPSLDYSPAYSPQRVRSIQEPLARASGGQQKLTSDRNPRGSSPLSSALQKRPLPQVDRPSAFSYKLERVKSVSLPYTSSLARPGGGPGASSHDGTEPANLEQKGQERNGLGSSLWDSLRPRSGLPHQYQGTEER